MANRLKAKGKSKKAKKKLFSGVDNNFGDDFSNLQRFIS
jgi:hypothetical protein